MALIEPSSQYILREKFDKLTFGPFQHQLSVDSGVSTPSTPSTPCSPGEPYTIEVLTVDDKSEVVSYLRRFFFKDEPLNHSSGLLEGRETCKELEEYSTKDSLDTGLSLKAVSGGKIIGICLNGIQERGFVDEEEESQCEDAKFAKILGLLEFVEKESDIFSKFPDVDKAMVVKILSVDSAWRGRGIAKELMNKTRDFARLHGCGIMSSECTSHFTAKALKRLGFECVYTLKYENYKVNGEVVFTPHSPHEAVTVYAQRISPNTK